MSNEELSKTLEKLHQELSHTPQLDEQTIESMRSLLEEIQASLSRSDSDDSHPLTITQRIQELITDFETRHPQLTATLSQIADRLTDMGI